MQITVHQRPGILRHIRAKAGQLRTFCSERAKHSYARASESVTSARAVAGTLARAVLPQPALAAIALGVKAPARVGKAEQTEELQHTRRWSFQWTHQRVIAALAAALSFASYIYFASQHETLAYSDAVSHLMIARRVVSSNTPGLAQLGTVWLPLQHVLMLPFVWCDVLFRSGLAGSLPSMAAFVLGTVYAYRTAVLIFKVPSSGWIAAAVFALNPNVLYLQSTPMTELCMLTAAMAVVYYLVSWVDTDSGLDLLKASLAAAAGMLVRYDGWVVACGGIVVVIWLGWKRYGWAGMEARALLFGIPIVSAGFGWLLYNYIIFHDAFAFFDGIYSAKQQQAQIRSQMGLPTQGNLLLSTHVYMSALVDCIGWGVVALAVVGMAIWALKHRSVLMLPAMVALAPFAFNIASLYLGVTSIFTPEVPLNGVSSYYNGRYGIMVLPALVLAAAAVGTLRLKMVPVVLSALLLVFGVANTVFATPYLLEEPLHGTGINAQVSSWLQAHYKGGKVLASFTPDAPILFFSGLPTQSLITESDATLFAQAAQDPDKYVEWVIIDTSTPANAVWRSLATNTDWQSNYVLREVDGTVHIYQRIGSN